MLKIIAQFYVKEDKIEEFLGYAKAAVEGTRQEAGCISYDVFQDTKDAAHFTFVENWESDEAIQFHFNTPHFKKFGEVSTPLKAKDGAIDILSQVL